LAVLFFIGACRRYRGTYLTTFNVPMGVALVGVWAGLSAVAIRIWPDLMNNFPHEMRPRAADQMTAGFAVAALLLIVPVHALATWEARFRVSPNGRAATLAATVLAALILLAGDGFNGFKAGMTLLVLAAHGVTVYAGLRLLARAKPTTAAVWIIVMLFGMWAVPILLEVVRWFFLPENREVVRNTDFTAISTFSPLGLLLIVWREDPHGPPLFPGLAFQMAVAVVFWSSMWRRGRTVAVAEQDASAGGGVMEGAPR